MGALVHFDPAGRWGETHVCESAIAPRLLGLGVTWHRRAQQAASQPVAAAAPESTRLFYLRDGEGFAGVLCEPDE